MNSKPQDRTSKKTWTPRIITLVVTFLAILYFYPRVEEDSLYTFKIGQVWDHGDLVTQDSLIVPPDTLKIRQIEDSLRSNFVNVYTPVPPNTVNIKAIIESVDLCLAQVLPPVDSGFFSNMFRKSPQFVIKTNVDRNLRHFYRGKVIDIGNSYRKPTRIELSEEVRSYTDTITTTAEILESIANTIDKAGLSSDVLESTDLSQYIVPNVILNKELSDERFNAELGMEIEKKTEIYTPGYRIVSRGEIVTPNRARLITMYTQKLLESGNAELRSWVLTLVGQAVYILLLIAVLVGYMSFYAPKVWSENRNFIFIISLVGLFVVISAIVSKFLVLGLYLVPIVMVPILVQVFFHARMALWAGFVTTLLCAGMSATGMQYVVIEFVGLTVAVYSLRDLAKRSQLLKTSMLVGVTYIVMYVAYQWMITGNFTDITVRMIVILAVNAVLTSVCYVLMFGVERIFGFISNVTLIELTDINTPLLRRLSDECPGTFNHVMAVSNLADDAARQIGANALLTRAGAMYHDIGKLANPTYFTENQHGYNPHSELTPQESAQIIINHVNEGLRLAEKGGLPKILRSFISEHHGAGQAKYFYFTYCKQHPGENVDPAPFTYPGPNPRSRETSVLMMADAIEAASRSLKEHTPEAITELVNKIIDGQIADGLHNDSPLSFHDIRVVKEVFIRRLMTMYHSRIAYPDDPNKKK